MEMEFIDLHVETSDATEVAKKLGVEEFVLVGAKNRQKDVYSGIVLKPKKGHVVSDVRANRNFDVVFVQGDEDMNREVSECWEIDVIASPELSSEKDYMKQRGSGVDLQIARFCTERGIAIEFNFNNVLQSYGDQRSRILARMAQNVRICRRAKCGMVITSGASKKEELRDAAVLIAFGEHIGMTVKEAKDAVTSAPKYILEKADRRKNPDVLMKGLTVLDWGDSEKNEKRLFGWY